ncbi:hypothetical protein ACFL96_18435 [Thermoproteota archaeon]
MNKVEKSGIVGIVLTVIGIALLLIVFMKSYEIFNTYYPFNTDQLSDIQSMLTLVLGSAIQVMFLGVMAWVGSILLMRGVDFMKVERGVGVVTFKVDKGVGVYTSTEDKQTSKEE